MTGMDPNVTTLSPIATSCGVVLVLLFFYLMGREWEDKPRRAPKPLKARTVPPKWNNVAVWSTCDAVGCRSLRGIANRSCLKCLGLGYVVEPYGTDYDLPLKVEESKPKEKARQMPQPPAIVKRKVFLHEYECFQSGLSGSNKAVSGRLWMCAKCGDTTDNIVPNPVGCPEPDLGRDPTGVAAAHREGKVEANEAGT